MSIFKKIFGTEKKNKGFELDDINNYNLKRIEPGLSQKIIGDCNEIIQTVSKLPNKEAEKNLHPKNLQTLCELWLQSNVNEEEIFSKIGVAYGHYICMKHGYSWAWAADKRTENNGQIHVQLGLVTSGSNNIIFPVEAAKQEVSAKDNYLVNHYESIIEKLGSEKVLPTYQKIEDYIINAKKSEKSIDVLNVWYRITKQEKLFFVCSNKDDIQDSVPFIGVIEDKPWYYVFTDEEKAKNFAMKNFKNENFGIIIQETESALTNIVASSKNGVFGVRVNENDYEINAHINAPLQLLSRFLSDIKEPAINDFFN